MYIASRSSAGILGLLFFCICLSGCRTYPVTQHTETTLSLAAPAERITITTDTLDSLYLGVGRKRLVSGVYVRTGQNPIWNETNDSAAHTLVALIRQARYYGLSPDDYHLALLDSLGRIDIGARHQSRREVLLTDAFFGLAEHLHFGRLFRASESEDSSRVALLLNALEHHHLIETLHDQEPRYQGYAALKKQLGMLLDNSGADDLEPMPSLDTIQARLRNTVMTLEINLERWRQERAILGNRYLLVNIPSFMLSVIEYDSVVLESRVIVGKSGTPTPVLSSEVQCFVTYPYWHVPRKISVEEILPLIKQNPSYIRRNNFDVLDRTGRLLNPDSVAWRTFHLNNFPVILRQREGSDNSLGIVKFVFDNPYSVFLHDTNAPWLFRNQDRALSHGCIRVEKAVALAHYLATGGVNGKSSLVSRYLREKTRHTIDLPSPVPIYIRYFTAEVVDGHLRLHNDIYQEDRRLMKRIAKK